MRSFHIYPDRHNVNTEISRPPTFRCRRSFAFPVYTLLWPVRNFIDMIHGQLGPAAAAPFSEQILLAFNGQVDIRAAYTWSRDMVINPSGHL